MTDKQNKDFAILFHKQYWQFFSKGNLTEEEKLDMLNVAYSSLTHWKAFKGSNVLNEQRGEYLIAKAWINLGDAENALRYADRCLEMTLSNPDLMQDFDVAFAYELKYKAEKLAGHDADAERCLATAKEKGNEIADKGDRDLFLEDLASEI